MSDNQKSQVDPVTSLSHSLDVLSFQNAPTNNEDSAMSKPHTLLHLPKELRLMIWNLCIPAARVIRVSAKNRRLSIKGRFSRVPLILHICKESRTYGLDIFCVGFGRIPFTFYWNPKIDTIYHLGGSDGYFSSALSHKIQHLALSFDVVEPFLDDDGVSEDNFASPLTQLFTWIHKYPSLKSLSFLIEPQKIHENLRSDWWKLISMRDVVVLYEPLDVKIGALLGMETTEFEDELEESLRGLQLIHKDLYDFDWTPPAIAVLVMGFKKFKRSGFCIPPRHTLVEEEE